MRKRELFKLSKLERSHKKRNSNWVLKGILLVIEGKKKIRLNLVIISCCGILIRKPTSLGLSGHRRGPMEHFLLKCLIGYRKL
jgi:hypothetical protein